MGTPGKLGQGVLSFCHSYRNVKFTARIILDDLEALEEEHCEVKEL